MRTNHHPVPAPVLRQARLRLLEDGDIPAGSIDERLARSWRRSLSAGLAPTGRLPSIDNLSNTELQRSLAHNHDLLRHSRPVMEYLFEQVRHSHSMVILANNRGVLMHTLGDADFLGKAERVALMSGASWNEQLRGTNAIGTALAEACDVEIHGSEHYLERNGFLTCAAAPIFAANGQLMGILDISGDHRARHPHTLGLVNTAARMIENRVVTASSQRHIRLHLHQQPDGIGSIAEGILQLSDDGWIVGANRQGLALLGLCSADIGATPLNHILDTRLEQMLSQSKRHPRHPLMVHRQDGQALYASIFAERSVPTSSRRLDAQPALVVPDALAAQDTGDLCWRSAANKARRILDKPIPLLLNGESGVGKEIFARAVHESSQRKTGAFVAINCAALPENLIEAELFGYTAGAFTGARKEGSSGRLREAEGGTLFLDEIGDMPLSMQSRLLRVLQERQVSPLGGGQAVKVDFSLICATHQNLREAMDKGSFRSDLYYRINGLTITLPPLRERTDFAALCQKLLNEFSEGSNLHLAPEVLKRFEAYRWPGNVRQLASALRTATAMLDPGETRIDWPHLPDDLLEELQAQTKPLTSPLHPGNLAELSRSAIEMSLENARGNVSAAARQLGISRQTLYRKLKR